MGNKFISLNLAGERYDYIYNPKAREVYTQLFPNVPVVRVNLGCGHSINHSTLLSIVEDKLKEWDMLESSFR